MRTLYHLWVHPFSRKVRIAMAEKKLEFKLEIEKIWERRTAFLAMNPAGDVPVLTEADGTILANSQVICEYLEETDDRNPMINGTAINRAEIRRLVALFGGIMLYLPCIGRRSERIPLLERIDGKNAFNGLLTVVNDYSARAVGWLTSPRLQAQMLMIVLVVIGGALLPFVDGPLRLGERLPAEIDPAFALLWAVGATCAVAAACLICAS